MKIESCFDEEKLHLKRERNKNWEFYFIDFFVVLWIGNKIERAEVGVDWNFYEISLNLAPKFMKNLDFDTNFGTINFVPCPINQNRKKSFHLLQMWVKSFSCDLLKWNWQKSKFVYVYRNWIREQFMFFHGKFFYLYKLGLALYGFLYRTFYSTDFSGV